MERFDIWLVVRCADLLVSGTWLEKLRTKPGWWISGQAPGEESFGPFTPDESRVRQLAPQHVPRRPVGGAGDLFFADDLPDFGDIGVPAAGEVLVARRHAR
jgi:hypothetical protein